jgi:uncharacterized membrane protein
LPWIPLETAAWLLYLRAIRISPLSVTVPFLALTPVFAVLPARVFLGEAVGPLALSGVALIVAGSWAVNLSSAAGGIAGPFRAAARERGVLLMVLVAAIFGVTSVIGKAIINHSSALYFAGHYTVVMCLVTAPLGLGRRPAAGASAARGAIVLTAVFFAAMILFHMLALAEGKVALMIALKRLSGVFGVAYGALIFRERGFASRLPGSLLMVVGGALVVLA